MSRIRTALDELTADRKKQAVPAAAGNANGEDALPRNNGKPPKTFSSGCRITIDYSALEEDGIIVPEDVRPALRDEIRRIKWPLLANAFGDQRASIPDGNIVMLASATSGEGKSFTAINLAMSIAAEKDIDVLLVDADIMKPHVSELFGLSERKGVTDYLAGEVDQVNEVIVDTDQAGLRLLPAGRSDPHASELIASSRMKAFVAELSAEFPRTVILFDTSPLLLTNESQVLSRTAGQVLLVVAANKTPREAVREAVSILGDDQVINIVFNGMKGFFGQEYRYGGYYGYSSRR